MSSGALRYQTEPSDTKWSPQIPNDDFVGVQCPQVTRSSVQSEVTVVS